MQHFWYIDVLTGSMKDYNHSFHRAVRARPVDVIPLNSVRVWKIKSKDWFKIKEYVPLLKKADHITVFITKEIWERLSSDDHEWNLLDSWNSGKGVGTHPCCLIDYGHEVMEEMFYPEEFQKVNPDEDRIYKTDKIIAVKVKIINSSPSPGHVAIGVWVRVK